jgi:(p)ppGpp synthase/HD superfamily hydrolase
MIREPDTLKRARDFAIKYHGDQMYGTRPYIEHLSQVYMTALCYGIKSEDILAACFLHDVLEDTECTEELLTEEFGLVIADLVKAVTDPEAPTRKERKKLLYEKLAGNVDAITVKLCDRLANVTAAGKIDMYRKEHPEFKEALYIEGEDTHSLLWTMIEAKLG